MPTQKGLRSSRIRIHALLPVPAQPEASPYRGNCHIRSTFHLSQSATHIFKSSAEESFQTGVGNAEVFTLVHLAIECILAGNNGMFCSGGISKMKVLAINGSPRKKWNTGILLEKALEGAASVGAETELVHLYDLSFKGCTSCFACKLKDGRSYGKCAMRDGLTPVLDKVHSADALVLGSPIYFGTVTGEMRSCMERLLFPYLTYTRPPASLFGRKIPTAFIYTMNVPESMMKEHYHVHIEQNANVLSRMFGQTESLCSFETLQFEDYDTVVFNYVNPEDRRERRRTVFPEDCRKAFAMGARMAQTSL